MAARKRVTASRVAPRAVDLKVESPPAEAAAEKPAPKRRRKPAAKAAEEPVLLAASEIVELPPVTPQPEMPLPVLPEPAPVSVSEPVSAPSAPLPALEELQRKVAALEGQLAAFTDLGRRLAAVEVDLRRVTKNQDAQFLKEASAKQDAVEPPPKIGRDWKAIGLLAASGVVLLGLFIALMDFGGPRPAAEVKEVVAMPALPISVRAPEPPPPSAPMRIDVPSSTSGLVSSSTSRTPTTSSHAAVTSAASGSAAPSGTATSGERRHRTKKGAGETRTRSGRTAVSGTAAEVEDYSNLKTDYTKHGSLEQALQEFQADVAREMHGEKPDAGASPSPELPKLQPHNMEMKLPEGPKLTMPINK